MKRNDDDDITPADEPPPYTFTAADIGAVTLETCAAPHVRPPPRPPAQPPRPRPSTSYAPPQHPPPSHRPDKGRKNHLPPPGPPSRPHSSASSASSASYGRSHHRPHGPPPQQSGYYNGPGPSTHHNGPQRPYYGANTNPHLRYPSGYWCPKCHNTGIKVRKGTTCQDCYDRFGVANQVQMLPYGVQPAFPVPPRVVAPGDPSIGGRLCGRCRGSGFITEMLFFDSTCPLCHGVGRVF